MSASFSATAGRRSARGASARARRSARASGSAVSTSRVRWSSVSPERPSAWARSARSYDARTWSHGRAGPAMHPRAVSEASSPARRRPWASGTRSSVASSDMSLRSTAWSTTPGRAPRTDRACASGTITAVSVVGGVHSARSAASCTCSVGDPSSRSAANRSSSRSRTRPVVASSSVWPATLAADSSSM